MGHMRRFSPGWGFAARSKQDLRRTPCRGQPRRLSGVNAAPGPTEPHCNPRETKRRIRPKSFVTIAPPGKRDPPFPSSRPRAIHPPDRKEETHMRAWAVVENGQPLKEIELPTP